MGGEEILSCKLIKKRCRTHLKQLSQSQQNLLIQHLGLVYAVAHSTWRRALLPAKHLDDLRQEALLEACSSTLRYQPGPIPYTRVLAFQVRKHLWRYIKKYLWDQEELLGEEDGLVLQPEEDDRTANLLELLPALPDRQREVLELRYGLTGAGPKTQLEVSQQLNLSKSGVPQAEKRALENLRKIYRGGLRVDGMSLTEIKETLSNGGKARAAALTSQQRKESARHASKIWWEKTKVNQNQTETSSGEPSISLLHC